MLRVRSLALDTVFADNANQPSRCSRRNEPAVLRKKLAPREAASAGRIRAIERIEQPLVDTGLSVEPKRVIETRHLHAPLPERQAVR